MSDVSRPRTSQLVWAAFGAAAALAPGLAMWGFTVDDALIAVRYAGSLASGAGYRFDVAAPVTDGVTPLPWAPILAALAAGPIDPLVLLTRAKVLGLGAWTGASALLALRAAEAAPSRSRLRVALAVLALAFPISAWAASGMETGLATCLATLAACSLARPPRAAILAGLAASLRPELLPWSVVVSAGAAITASRTSAAGWSSPRALRPVVLAASAGAGPFFACVAIRLAVFGRPAPLAVLAKPSDLDHGATYAAAAAVVVLVPLLACAPIRIARGSGRARVLALAFAAHVVAVALAGGDWMPYARLLVPVTPSLVLVAVDVAGGAAFAVRAAVAVALGGLLAVRAAPAGRRVTRDRADLVLAARPLLAEARVIAGLDVGWLSAAVPPHVRIVDLAGLTDPEIAVLGGGHTSKRVDLSMLDARSVDTFVAYDAARVVEQRLLSTPRFAETFTRIATLPLGTAGASYGVYRRVAR